jgi:N-acetylglutamate synthase-like GNAT family acetyltransferase
MNVREQVSVKLSVRRAVTQDISQIQDLKSGQLSAETLLAQSTHRLREVEVGRAEYLIVELEGQIIGHAFLKFYGKPTAPDYPDIEDLYVHPDFRRKGIATELLSSCETIAQARGFPALGWLLGLMKMTQEESFMRSWDTSKPEIKATLMRYITALKIG